VEHVIGRGQGKGASTYRVEEPADDHDPGRASQKDVGCLEEEQFPRQTQESICLIPGACLEGQPDAVALLKNALHQGGKCLPEGEGQDLIELSTKLLEILVVRKRLMALIAIEESIEAQALREEVLEALGLLLDVCPKGAASKRPRRLANLQLKGPLILIIDLARESKDNVLVCDLLHRVGLCLWRKLALVKSFEVIAQGFRPNSRVLIKI
jgi:hypothetical protein